MPSFAHFVLGSCFGLLLYYISGKKFTKAHVFILFLNNYLGPDIGWVIGIGDITHTLVGSVGFALILALFNSYFTRFSPDFKNKTLIDLGKPRVDYLSAFFVVLAGLIMHNYLDAIINYRGTFYIWPTIGSIERFDMGIGQFVEIWGEGILPIHSLATIVVDGVFILAYFYLLVVLLKNWNKKSIFAIFGIIALFLVAFYLLGFQMTNYHADAGAILYLSIYWLCPLFLCALSIRNYLEKLESLKPHLSELTNGITNFGWILALLWGLLLILIGIGLSAGSAILINLIVEYFTLWDDFAAELELYFVIAGIFLLFSGLITLILFKSKRMIVIKSLGWRYLILLGWLSLTGLLGSLGGLAGIIMPNATERLLYTYIPDAINSYLSVDQLQTLIPIVGAALFGLGLFNMILFIGLAAHIRILWRIAFFYHSLLAISTIGLAIACFLSQSNISKIMDFNIEEKEKEKQVITALNTHN